MPYNGIKYKQLTFKRGTDHCLIPYDTALIGAYLIVLFHERDRWLVWAYLLFSVTVFFTGGLGKGERQRSRNEGFSKLPIYSPPFLLNLCYATFFSSRFIINLCTQSNYDITEDNSNR